MISKLDNTLGIFVWCLCLFAAIEACFTPVQLPTPRSGVCIVESNGMIYFAGGDDASGQALPLIDIYDVTTDTWSRLWLQTARVWMRCHAVGDYVVFAFGYGSRTGGDLYTAADILDTRSQTMTTVNLPSIGLQAVHVFGQYVAYHYGDQFVFLDPSTGALKSTSIWLNLSVSNSTHLFGVSARNNMLQIYPFDVDTLSVNPEPSYNISMKISAFGLPSLHLLEGQLVIRDISDLRTYSFGAEPPEVIELNIYVPSTVSTVYGSTIYFIGPSVIVTYSQRTGFISYSVPAMGFTPLNLPVAVSNGILFLSGDAGLTTTACIVLNGLVQHSIGAFKFKRRDIGLTVSSQAGEFAWLNLHTRQVRRQQLNQWVSDEYVELDDYWVFPIGILFHLPTETWTSFPSPLSRGRLLSTALQGTVAVFMDERRDFRIFNVTDLSWRELPGPGFLPNVITAVRNKIITLSSMGEIDVLDIVTNNRTSFHLGVVGPSFVTTDDLFILAAVWNTSNVPIIPADTVVIYNAVTNTFQYHRLAVAGLLRSLVQSKTHVFFVTSTFIIEIYNIAEGTWSHTNMPYHFNDAGLEAVAALSTLVIRRPQRVDVFDTSINEWRVLADAPVDALFTSMKAFGSKVLFTVERGVLIYEITSANWLRIESVPRNIQVTDSFVVWSEGFSIMYQPISALTNRLQSQSAYETHSIQLDPGVIGLNPFRIGWLHNGVSLNSNNTLITLNDIQQYHNGYYSMRAVDQCNMLMLQSMQLHVITRPTFAQPLEDSISLCHKPVVITAQVNGNASFQWTINGVVQTTDVTSLSIEPDKLQCNMRHQLCLKATNPSGANQTCGHLRLLEHDMLFDGPRPTEDHTTWFMGSLVTLRTKLLDDDCTRHWWLIDGIMQDPIDSQESSIAVNISVLSSYTKYAIRAQCGSSFVTSNPFTFKNVSTLTVGYLVLIIVLVFAAVLASLIAAVLVRRRIKAGEVHETELQTLLTQAKSESLNRDGVSVIPATTWEWKPNEEFTYKPLDDLPCAIESAMLSHHSRDNTVKVDTWNQSEIVFTLKSKKTKKSESMLKERLIDGLQIDIYAPQSPKYEVKVEPSSFTLRQGKTITVTVSTLMRMTTKVKIGLVVVIEQQLVYAILEYKMASAMSTWIDLEEVEMTGDFLGGGGFGSVTRGVYRGEEVAVKRLLNQYMIEELKQEFEREITLMKDLRHPNIVQFVGASNIKDNLAILIEYAPLGSLSSVLQRTKLSYTMKLTILLESAKALQFLHLNRVIHRDIKPQNILVFSLEPKASVHVKLTDFGTSRFISDASVTVTKNVGTITYMAPEALGKNPRIDKSADIYSFALLIWELMYERQPFAEFDWQSDIENHVKSGGRLPLDRVSGVKNELIKLIEDCWHQDPASRPSASEVVQRISDLI